MDKRKEPWRDPEIKAAQHIHALGFMLLREADESEIDCYMATHKTGLYALIEAEVFVMGYRAALKDRDQ
jgi:hypothetical protein